MSNYAEIIWSLKEPAIGAMLDMPDTPQAWTSFFGMMERLERTEIAIFQNGRYMLHPKRKADVVKQAEAVLAEISKPLTMDAPVEEVMVVAAPVMPEFNVCPVCKGKGRVNIEDAMGFFGNFLCLTCMGNKQIPVPPRSSFPPVDFSKKPQSPNALLFAENPKPVAPIPQALEVGGVRVIVEAPAPVLTLTMPVVSAEDAAEGLLAIAAPAKLVPADCFACKGLGVVEDPNSQHPYVRVMSCAVCGGTGKDVVEVSAAILNDGTQLLPAIDSPEDELPIADTIEPIDAMGDGGFVWHDKLEEAADAAPKKYVRINTTGRGLSSGKYEVIRQEEKYGRSWMVVKFTTDKGLPHWFSAEICELAVESQPAPKAVEVVAPKPHLLDGLPIMQAIATHGIEDTKAALNVVHQRVVAEVLSADKLLLAEGQGVS